MISDTKTETVGNVGLVSMASVVSDISVALTNSQNFLIDFEFTLQVGLAVNCGRPKELSSFQSFSSNNTWSATEKVVYMPT